MWPLLSLARAYNRRFANLIRPSQLLSIAGLVLCLATSAFASDQALLILKSNSYADTEATMTALDKVGAHADHVFPPKTIIAYVPADAEAKVKALSNVAEFYRGPAPLPAGVDSDLSEDIAAWNSIVQPQPADGKVGSPLVGDTRPCPAPKAAASAGTPVRAGVTSYAPAYYDTSCYLAGKVAVGIVLPESTGPGETWSKGQGPQILSEITSGLNWWVAMKRGSTPLTFVYDKHMSVSTKYEPISESSDYNWMSDVLKNMGYIDSYAYINDIRTKLNTDWSFVYYVVNSYNDSDGTFPSGYFGYACVGGPYVVMTWDNDGWGIANMDKVAKHEMGHIFNCGDEYCSPGYACCDFGYWGYLGVYNGNCELNNPNSVDCVMKSNSDVICQYTLGQIGWTDTDADGLPDVLDNTVNVVLDPQPNPARLSTITFTGTAKNIPCPAYYSTGVTINKISSIKYRVDGGDWLDATPVDGALNLDAEQFKFTTPALANGPHKVEVQASAIPSGNSSGILTYDFEVTDPDLTPPTITSVTDEGDIIYDDSILTCDVVATDPDSGVYGYQYALGTTPTDPGTGYTRDWTYAGNNSHVVADNLSLANGQIYYFYVKVKNASDIWSAVAATNGIKIAAVNIGQAKNLPDGTWVAFKEKIVTGGFGWPYNYFYIQEPDRSAAIRVRSDQYVSAGLKVTVKGNLRPVSADTNNERELQAVVIATINTPFTMPRPLAIIGKAIGGGSYGMLPGIPLANGLNNCGLYVRMVGKVTRIGEDHYFITDGSVYNYYVLENGEKKLKTQKIEVCVNNWPPYQLAVGDYMMITGIAGIYAPNGLDTAVPMIRPREYDDMVKL